MIGEEIIASLVVKNLAKSFAGTKVLDDVCFAVADGEFCVLLGPSGCGKTTLLRIVAGLETASSGEIQIDTARVDTLPPGARDVAFVFQNYALYPHMTVFENLGFALRLQKVPKIEIQDRVAEVARLLEIDKQLQQKPQQLSGGQRQRVALGRAIVRRPKLFLFDEPLSNLDATLRASMRVELAKLHERLGATMLYVTHDQAEAMTLGEKIIILNRGSIQQAGKPGDIYHRPANTFVAGFVGQPQMNLFEGRLNESGSVLNAGGFGFDLPAALLDLGGAYRRAPVTVGIRPEDLVSCGPREAWFSGTADFVEDLGSDRFVHVSCGKLRLVARLPARSQIQRGEGVNLKSDFERVHLFHEGQRIKLNPL